MSDSLPSHGLQAARLLCPWDFPGKSTGVGCHLLSEISQFTHVEFKIQKNKQNRNRLVDTENKLVVARRGGVGIG